MTSAAERIIRMSRLEAVITGLHGEQVGAQQPYDSK